MCFVSGQFSFDPCDSSLCDVGVQHIACENSGNWSASCSPDKKVIEIDEDLKQKIVAAHNKWRNTAAQGILNLTASKMATILWGEELAKLAELNVKKCILKHDACVNTPMYKNVGQNLGISTLKGVFQEPGPTVIGLINKWYEDEVGMATLEFIQNCCESPK